MDPQVLRNGGADVPWTAKRPEGRALGIALTERSGSLGAGVVETRSTAKNGKITVHKVWVAVDGGISSTLRQPEANVESAILYGLSSILHERNHVEGRRRRADQLPLHTT